jgi:hypothetical protein
MGNILVVFPAILRAPRCSKWSPMFLAIAVAMTAVSASLPAAERLETG